MIRPVSHVALISEWRALKAFWVAQRERAEETGRRIKEAQRAR